MLRAQRRWHHEHVRRGLSFLLVGLLGAVAAVLALQIDEAKGEVGPGRVAVRARFGEPRTELRLPPLGQVSAPTHQSPVTLEAAVVEVDVDRLQALLAGDDPGDRLRHEVSADLEPLLRTFAVQALLAAAVAGALAGALVPRRRWTHAVAGLLGGVVAVSALLGLAWRGYDPDAFGEARFEGPLERAPALFATLRRHVDGYDDVRRRVEALGDQVAELYAVASTSGSQPGEGEVGALAAGADEVRILHVSDIHSNPLGLEVTRQLAERFAVDAVLDTGDLTSFGLPIEGRLGELIENIPVPYLFVPGNHDSDGNREALDAVANVELVDGRVVDVKGVRILGIADPTFTATNRVDSEQARAAKRNAAPEVVAAVDFNQPDVLAVHDPVLGEAAWGRVPLIVAGHTHQRASARHDGTLVLTVASTGSTGLGSFLIDTKKSYEAEVLRFVAGDLVSIDRVALRGVDGGFRVERQLIRPPGRPQVAGRIEDPPAN
ncbi:MAG: metallophosphoesterase family protein [Acidimicrobiia bacterium]